MEIKEELTRLLSSQASGMVSPVLDLESVPGDKVGGFVISPTFSGMPQIDRQNLIWGYLDERLPPERALKIVTLVTLAPEEAGDDE